MNDRKKILVVDDDPLNLTVILGMLSGAYKMYPVDSGETALEFLGKKRPDLILLDVEMAGMSGKELFSAIKSDGNLAGIPVIFMTANNDMEDEAGAFSLGISDYIRKPVNEIILRARVGMHLELAAYRASV